MGEIIYNGRSSKEIGLEVETFPSYQSPKRSYEKLHIPGRNGDLLIDKGCWENVVREYSVSIGSLETSYDEMIRKVVEWLCSDSSYTRLEDSYEPDHYRLAVYLNDLSFTNIENQGGKATIEFDCKPQRFLKTGDFPIKVINGMKIQNPTPFPSLPIFEVHGSGAGVLVVGNYTLTISDIGEGIIIDSEIQDAYYGTMNKNKVISLPTGFPRLEPGVISIGYSGGINRVEVVPKWYTL